MSTRVMRIVLSVLVLWLGGVSASFPASIALEHVWGGYLTTPCANGGTTVINSSQIGTQIGRVSYLTLRFTNSGANPIGVSPITVTGRSGCDIPFNVVRAFTVAGSGGSYEVELGVRPTAANWSFTMGVDLTGDTSATYSHTFSQNGATMGSGSQVELYWEYSGATKHSYDSRIGYGATQPVVGVPIELQICTSNRSALSNLTITSPGWMVDNGTTGNATASFESQLPSSLGTDAYVISTFRVTPTAAGVFRGNFICHTDDGMIQVDIAGTAAANTKLRAFHGTREMASNGSQVVVSGTAVGAATNVSFLIRNDEASTVSFWYSISGETGCTTSTVTAPTLTLAAGQQTTWVIAVTPTTSTWKCLPSIMQQVAPFRQVSWTLRNDAPRAPADASSIGGSSPGGSGGGGGGEGDSASSSGCGLGSGVASLLLMMGLIGLGCCRMNSHRRT